MWLQKMVMLATLVLFPICTEAGQARPLTHYVHQHWLEGSEAPVPVTSIAQGSEGFIWLATGDGLFRFDGIRFELIDTNPSRKHDPPSALLVTRAGDVWTNFETSRRFAIYTKGVLRLLDGPPAPTRIVQFAEGADEAIWALTSNYNAEVMRYKDGTWRSFSSRDGLPQSNASTMLVAKDGTLWIGCSTGLARLRPGAMVFEFIPMTSSSRISQDLKGRVWVSNDDGTYPVTGPEGEDTSRRMRSFPTGAIDIRGAPVFDREGNLWLATRHEGVQRFAAGRTSPPRGDVRSELFTSREGLSSDVTNQVFEDREGNLWVGTEGGLDRLRVATLVQDPRLDAPAVYGDKLLEGAGGTIYIGQAETLYRVLPEGSPEPLIHYLVEPEALCEDGDGALWVALRDHILVWSHAKSSKRIERPDRGANHNIVYDCAFDKEGRYWISAAGGGVHRYANGRWEKMFAAGDHADFYPTTMTGTPDGGVVVQSGDRLIWFNDGVRLTTNIDFGEDNLRVLTLQRSGHNLYAAGAFGLARYRGKAIDTALAPEVSRGSRINGIAETPSGDMWLAYPKALVRISSSELAGAFLRRELPDPSLTLGRGDGLSSRPHSHSQRSLARGGDGRLWIATETGTLWMDPARIVTNLVPPGVAITAIRDDRRTYRDPHTTRLPAATSKIEIDYAVLSFSDQQRVRARYRLEGFDRDWVHPGQRRQAFYTNLAPGRYRFHVMAANDDGVWNPVGAVVDFEIPKKFYQSAWFLATCLASVLIILFALHRLRVGQAARRVQVRLEERNAERLRIARELHDTLLQGVVGLILRFQAVANRLSREDASSIRLEAALAEADAVVVDARKRVRDLRGSEDGEDLLLGLERIVAETPFEPAVPIRIVVEGRPQPLNPLVSKEVSKIVREALLNIAHHAHATSAELSIGFEPRRFAIRINDRGVGFPEHVLRRGHKEGHFGLVGMRERAERIGGTLVISSASGQGSEVMLILPAKLAYAKPVPHTPWWRWWRTTRRLDNE